MNHILTIARNTFKESIRDRILYGILGFALLFLISTIFFGTISLGEDIRIIKDFGLAGIYIFSLIITIFLGTSLIYKELEKKTVYILFSKPVSSVEFLLGKYLGLLASIILNIALMTAVYLAIIAVKGGGFDYLALLALLLQVFEIAIFVAITILFSSFTTPLAGTIYSVILLYIGHSLSLLKQSTENSSSIIKFLADVIYYTFPNLEKFNIRNTVVYNSIPNAGQIIYPIVYSVFLVVILIWLANAAIKKQEL